MVLTFPKSCQAIDAELLGHKFTSVTMVRYDSRYPEGAKAE
jgi:hypothetical protein